MGEEPDLKKIFDAINSIEVSPASVDVFGKLFSEVKQNSKTHELHMIHVSRMASSVYDLKVEELYGLVDEIMVEAGLLKTDDYVKFPHFFKNFSSKSNPSVSYSFYEETTEGSLKLIRSGKVFDVETLVDTFGVEHDVNSEPIMAKNSTVETDKTQQRCFSEWLDGLSLEPVLEKIDSFVIKIVSIVETNFEQPVMRKTREVWNKIVNKIGVKQWRQ